MANAQFISNKTLIICAEHALARPNSAW